MAQLGLNETVNGVALTGMKQRYLGALGHIKIEVVNLDAPSAADYFYTRLANPVGLFVCPTEDSGGDITVGCTLSGKTVTVSAEATGKDLGVLIFGY